MAKPLEEWLESDVAEVRDQPVRWLSEEHFFRDPIRPVYSDSAYFFAPADGVIIYQARLRPDEALLEIKGRRCTLQEALRDPTYDCESLVVGIFMTFYDVHVNRVPFAGRLSYRLLEPLGTHNVPMLLVEKHLLDDLRLEPDAAEYVLENQRMLNRIHAPDLGLTYTVLQIADFDVDSIIPFELRQNWPCDQNQRFSQIRYGSQVDLIVPLTPGLELRFTQEPLTHVEAGLDTLLHITRGEGA